MDGWDVECVIYVEKAKHGDLYQFMTYGPGQQLGSER